MLARVVLWLLLVLTSVEIALRATGWYLLRSRARAVEAKLPADAYRMLFIGESTTYGLWVEPGEAYPAQVASLLGARHPGRSFVAINRGVPSLTTTAMLRTFSEKLRLLAPRMVLILVGVNDFHTQYNAVRLPGEGWLPRPLGDVVGTLRLFRVLDLWLELRKPKAESAEGEWLEARGGVELGQKELFYDLGSGHHVIYAARPGEQALAARLTDKLEGNLTRMIAQSRESGAQVELLGYLRAPYENRVLERVAQRAGVPFVRTFIPSAASPEAPLDLFARDRFHPSVSGHRVMAERIVEAVDALVGPPASESHH